MSRLAPAGEGDLPTKLVFQGIDPGSPESRLLGARLGGEIRHFQNSARQQRGEQPTHHQIKAMPNGRGRMTYSYNQGIETLRVHLEPEYQKQLLSEPEKDRPGRADPTLAIDVLFTNELWTAYDIYSITSEVVTPGGTYPSTPERWEVLRDTPPSVYLDEYFGSDAHRYRNIESSTQRVEFYSMIGRPLAFVSDFSHLDDFYNRSGPVEGYHVWLIITGEMSGWYGWNPFQRVILIGIGDREPGTPGGSYPPRVDRTYGREERDYFDVLIPAAAQVAPAQDEPYEAIALGRTGRRDDARLVPCSELQVSKACSRRFTAQAGSLPTAGGEGGEGGGGGSFPPQSDAPPFWAGQGFLARPVKKQIVGVPVEKTRIDIYIGSSNNSQRNQFPNTPHEFDLVKEWLSGQVKVQVREFAEAPPVGVRVDLETDMVKRTYASPGPNMGPSQQVTSTSGPSTPPHVGTWHFAAGPNWVDGGNEPAEPDRKDSDGKDMMGKLLDQKLFDLVNLAKLDPIPNALLHEATWPGEAAGRMTYLCTIEWTPPEEVWLKGTAKIL